MHMSKMKTILIYKYLLEYSDVDHPLSTTDLIDLLSGHNCTAERKSIYSDIKVLNEIGCNIVTVHSPKRGYYIASRSFEVPEVRLLIDAVNSAGFITPDKTVSLIDKLKGLLSENQARELASQVYCENTNKCDNEEIYHIIDTIDEAIHNGYMLKFVYRNRNIDRENKKSYTTKTFVVSPYALLWKDDRYYLVCNKSTHDNLMNLRLDRMRKIQILKCDARPVSECSSYDKKFDAADYSAKMFNMFSGTDDKVCLKCDLDLREQILDRFGPCVPLKAVDAEHFETEIKAAISDGLVSWLMQFGNKVKVVEPSYLADMILEKAQSIVNIY